MIAAIAPAAGSRGSPEKPVPRIASTIAPAPASAPASNGAGSAPGQTLESCPRVAAQLARVPEQEHVDLATPLAQQPGRDEPVAAVVALAAHDDDPSGRRHLTSQVGQPGAGALHQLEARDPALADRPLVERPLLAGVGERLKPVRKRRHRAPEPNGSASHGDRDRSGVPLGVGQRHLDLHTELGRARRSRTR